MRRRLEWLVSMVAMLVTGFLIWSRKPTGTTMSDPQDEPEIKSLASFDAETPLATKSQRMLFFAANRLHRKGDIQGATRLLEHLVDELPGNSVVRHNLDISRQRRG
jgi:hypothetical protein